MSVNGIFCIRNITYASTSLTARILNEMHVASPPSSIPPPPLPHQASLANDSHLQIFRSPSVAPRQNFCMSSRHGNEVSVCSASPLCMLAAVTVISQGEGDDLVSFPYTSHETRSVERSSASPRPQIPLCCLNTLRSCCVASSLLAGFGERAGGRAHGKPLQVS